MSVLVALLSTHASPQSSLLKAEADRNMYCMLVTRPTSHLERSWLKAEAQENISRMSVTLLTSHAERSWLKAEAE